ncbi:hypothetical protein YASMINEVIRUS_881 [Yasminevirus sp. GU-2018]|uniref:Uncharacterized protein n=1 Tax=Yasminevirus sp. GU-2018 TaxID=2420051 RepID=A0A5K0U8M6_9VIRU|nr:hypothetical protein YASMINEVIRUS_881 [Yasminevirus sp. GU-2018]
MDQYIGACLRMNNNYSDNDDWGAIVDYNTTTVIPQTLRLEPTTSEEKKDDRHRAIDHIDIDDIKSCDISSMLDLCLLEKASLIAKNLKFQFTKRHDENLETFMRWMISSLDWLNCVMTELARRSNQQAVEAPQRPMSKNRLKKQTSISRNSYKFCEFGASCRFNYGMDVSNSTVKTEHCEIKIQESKQNDGKIHGCYSQHYVFALVSRDIVEVLRYIVSSRDVNYLSGLIKTNEILEMIKSPNQTGGSTINNMHIEPVTTVTAINTVNNGKAVRATPLSDAEIGEIRTSINTITYVINHMYDELANLKTNNQACYENYESHTNNYRGKVIKKRSKEVKNNLSN